MIDFNRKVYSELQEWAAAGLISNFNMNSFQNDVMADVLRAIREHLLDLVEANKRAEH